MLHLVNRSSGSLANWTATHALNVISYADFAGYEVEKKKLKSLWILVTVCKL